MIAPAQQALILSAVVALSTGCGPGQLPRLSTSGQVLAEATWVADELGALHEQRCLDRHGRGGCASYPNPRACVSLHVVVDSAATAHADCQTGERRESLVGMLDGVPMACASRDERCVSCADLYGRIVFDSCSLQRITGHTFGAIDSKSIQGLSGTTVTEIVQQLAGSTAPPTIAGGADPTTETISPDPPVILAPQPTSDSQCVGQGREAFVRELNQILADNGLNFSLQLDAAHPSALHRWRAELLAQQLSCQAPRNTTECDQAALADGHCYCSDEHTMVGSWGGATCRCPRMTASAAFAACGTRPADCPEDQVDAYRRGIAEALVAASFWLNPKGSSQPRAKVASLDAANSPADLACMNSPIVVDLFGDGLALTSARGGVDFALDGRHVARTAWIRGQDDALLVIDRNGNGKVDGGSELFGEAPSVAGTLEPDGFSALSWLDTRRFGGNQNGLIDPADASFAALLLWNDRNGDGRSTSEELTPLAATDIVALSTQGGRPFGQRFDTYGNELGLRGFFLRRGGGAGTLVDVYFSSGQFPRAGR